MQKGSEENPGAERKFIRLLEAVLDRDSYRDGSADHGVVTHAEEAHHFNVSWN